jgi:NitT/TauT family transport system permease protein
MRTEPGVSDTAEDPELSGIVIVGVGDGSGGSATVAAVPMPRPAKGESGWAVVWPPLLLGVVLIAVWYAITYLVLDEQRRFLLPAPHQVISEGFLGEDRRGDSSMSIILNGLRRSAIVAAMGLGISIVIGFTTAVIMSQSVKAERAIFPYMVMLQATPILALVPLIGFWFGFSTMPRVIVCVIISLFPIIVNTLFGLQSADQGMHDLFTLQHANRFTRLRTLMFPAAMPAIFAGLRISAGLAVIGAIVGDFFFGQGTPGLGQVLKRATGNNESELLIATVIVACLLGVAVFLFFGWLGRKVTSRWHSTTGAG